jgi:Lon protease-like protein
MVENLGMQGDTDSQQMLANQLAYLLPFNADQKVALLDTSNPDERLERIQRLIDALQGGMPA